MKNDGITLHIGDDGIARVYDDTYDITIHRESAEEQEKAMELLKVKTLIGCQSRTETNGNRL